MTHHWSTPYNGIQHTLDAYVRHSAWRCTVVDRNTWAELHCWYPGCGFSPIETRHDSVELARAAGEAWLDANDRNSTTPPTP